MVGLSLGPRKFAMMKSPLWWKSKLADGVANIETNPRNNAGGWEFLLLNGPTGPYNDPWPMMCWNDTKLDLRALNQGGKGLDIGGLALQEGAWIAANNKGWVTTGGGVEKPEFDSPVYMWDVVTTEKMTPQALYAMIAGYQCPSFLALSDDYAFPDAGTAPDFTPSMVLWGLWRYLVPSRNFEAPQIFELVQSSEFGFAETLVAPQVYWTRVFIIPDVRTNTGDAPASPYINEYFCPPANLILSGSVRDLTDGEEMAQMSRSLGR